MIRNRKKRKAKRANALLAFLVRVARLDILMSQSRQAGIEQVSTGHLYLFFRHSPLKREKAKEQMLFCLFWSEWRDSNSRHPAPKAGALPAALHPDTENVLYTKRMEKATEK